MAKIRAIIDVYEKEIRAEAEQEDLAAAIDQELGWLHDSGMAVETWDYIDRPSRFPPALHSELDNCGKAKLCPVGETCQKECFGDPLCEFARTFEQISFQLGLQDTCIQSLRAERDAAKSSGSGHRVFGAYVLTPIPNAFNHKTSWWISKAGSTLACYCFTASDPAEIEYQVKNALNQYIRILERQLGNPGMDSLSD